MSSSNSTPESLDALRERLGIVEWDFLLVGDGSGSTWDRECGWGCVSIERETMHRRSWHGAMNSGTVNFAEMMAYLQPLTWYVSRELQQRKSGKKVQVRHVHIVTDSSYVGGLKASPDLLTGPNGALWQVFKQFTSQGILIRWHWIRRETVELNQFADRLSKAARINLKDKDLPAQVADSYHPSRTMYGFNSWD